ncbi:MAG: hypothetical protein ACYDCO_20285 [Armatimonadota bacterium]
MSRFLRMLLAAAALALATAGLAYPNFNGSTGIIAVPNALIQADGAFFGAADVIFFDDAAINARAVLGLTDNLEVGAALILGDNTGFGVSGKFRLPVATGAGAWAVGLSFADTDEGGSGYQAFVVTSRTLTGAADGMDLLGSLGATFTDFENATGFRPFIGAQLMLPGAFEIDGEFELEAGDFTDSIFSLGVRRQFTSTLGGELGFTNARGFLGEGDASFFLGVNIALPSPGI